jgi:hypothetical protein
MTESKLKAGAKKLVNDFYADITSTDEIEVQARDLIDLYESIVDLAVAHAQEIQYEAEEKLSHLTGIPE